MKTSIYFIAMILALGAISCDELSDATSLTDGNFMAAEEEVLSLALTQALGEEDHSIAMEKAGKFAGNKGRGHHLADCADVTVSGDGFPKEISIDFGEGCTDWRGHMKSGQMIITISDSMHLAGAERTVTFVEFSIGPNVIEGTKTITNSGQNEDGHWVVLKESELTITKEDGTTLTREISGSREWLEGFGTPQKLDDIFLLTSTGTMTRDDGTVYNRSTVEPLLIDHSCRFILSGVVEVSNSQTTMSIDFGEGTCDNTATVTRDGETQEIDLAECKMKRKMHRHQKGKGNNKGNGNGKG